MTLRAKLPVTTLRERRKAFADGCLMAHQMRKKPLRPNSQLQGRTVRMSNQTYTVGPRGNFIRQ